MSFFSSISGWFGTSDTTSIYIDPTVPTIADADIEQQGINVAFARKVRELIRSLSVSNPDIASVVETQKAGIIGQGVNIQSRILGEPELNEEIEAFIREFSEPDNCEVSGRWHLNSLWRSMVEFNIKEGGFIIRHHYNNSWAIPYRVELISVSEIDTNGGLLNPTTRSPEATNGIVTDSYGRVTGIYIYNTTARTTSTLVSAEDLIFYSPVWVSISQYTAISKLASILPSIQELDDYTDAELTSAVNSAKNGAYWRTNLYSDIMGIVNKIQDASVKNEKLSTLMATISQQTVKPQGLTPIPLEDDIIMNTSTSSSVYTDINDETKLKIGSSQGVGSALVYQDAGSANYSSLKMIMALSQINWSIDFDDLREMVMKPIINKVVSTGVMMGRIKVTNYFSEPLKYKKLTYMRVSEIDIEPSKTAQAQQTQLETGLYSKRELVAKRGRNLEDVQREEITDEIRAITMREELFKEAGVEIPTVETDIKDKPKLKPEKRTQNECYRSKW